MLQLWVCDIGFHLSFLLAIKYNCGTAVSNVIFQNGEYFLVKFQTK